MSKPYDPHQGIELPELTPSDAALTKQAFRHIVESLGRVRTAHIDLVSDEGDVMVIPIPRPALRVIAETLAALGHGKAVALLPVDRDMTPSQAAHFLNVSKPFVIQQMESGKLPFYEFGRHRRVTVEDLLAFREHMRSGQREALKELARTDDELGLDH